MSNEGTEKDLLDPKESMRVIRQVIDVAKKSAQEDGFHFMLWGGIVPVSAVTEWYLWRSTDFGAPWVVWGILPAIGGLIAMLYEWRRGRSGRPENMVRTWYSWVWGAFVLSLVLALFFATQNRLSPAPLVLTLSAFATFLSGLMLQFAPLRWGALVQWIGAAVCFFIAPQDGNLVLALATVLAYLVPGIMLHREYRRSHVR